MGMGKQIEKLLEDIDMNVNELSNKIGVRPQRIYNIIARDTKKVNKELIEKIAKLLGVPTNYFYTDASLDDYTRSEGKKSVNFSISKRDEPIDKEEYRKKAEAEWKRRKETYDGGSRLLLIRFNQLNKEGKKELLKRASELVRLEEYSYKTPEDCK